MTERQESMLQLFREFDEICRENDLRYVVAGGTAIGVVRNEGFIPWDDDMDVYMPRDDWEKLVQISETALPPNRTLLSVDIDRDYTNSFPRYGYTDNCTIHKHQIIGKDVAGEVIDVLVLDPIPDDDREYEKYRTHMMIYSDLVNMVAVFGARWEVPAGKYLKYLFLSKVIGRDRTLKKLEKIMFSYKEEECSRYAMRWGGCPFLFDKDMFFPVKDMEFEGMKAMTPRRLHDYLTWHYGDEWCYIPPHHERESHESIFVPDTLYQEVRDDYLPFLNKGRLRRDAVLRKLYYLRAAKRTHKLQLERNRLNAKKVQMDLDTRIRESRHSVRELLEKNDFAKLNHIFSGYFRVQLSAELIGREDYGNIYAFYHPVLIGISEENFTAAMMTLVYTERIGKAFRMLQVKESLGSLNEDMKQLKEDILLFRKCVSSYEYGEAETAETILGQLMEKYPQVPGFMKMQIRFIMERAQKDGHAGEGERFLENALELFPEDGYFLKYKGDLLWMKGRCADALEVYVDAREKTNNGITHLEIEKFLVPYRDDMIKTCQMYVRTHQKGEALKLMELWNRLLPEDQTVREWLYFARVNAARNRAEMEALVEEITEKVEFSFSGEYRPEEATEDPVIYKRALTRAWERLGYPTELAKIRTDLFFTEQVEELEWLAEKAKDSSLKKEKRAEVYKVAGDARRMQGQTPQAFECYRKALDAAGERSYVKTELSRIYMEDWYQGNKKAMTYAKKTDASEYLEQWLGKYGSLEEIRAIAEKIGR